MFKLGKALKSEFNLRHDLKKWNKKQQPFSFRFYLQFKLFLEEQLFSEHQKILLDADNCLTS